MHSNGVSASDPALEHQPKSARRRRWSRFSLRTLLIVVTLVAVWLAFKTNQARQLAEDLRAVQELGGFVEYEHQFANGTWGGGRNINAPMPGPAWLRGFVGDEYFVRPVGLQFAEVPVEDDDLVHVARLTDLQYLSFLAGRGDRRIQGPGLAHLRGLNQLRSLDLLAHPVNDAALIALKDLPRLECIDLRSTTVTDAGLVHLASISSLRHLALSNTAVTDEGLMQLKSLPNLRTVTVRNTKVTAEGAAELQNHLPNCTVMREYTK